MKKKIKFLRVENKILRNKCPYKRMVLANKEQNRLIKFGQPLGGDIKRLISIVSPSAFYDWIRKKHNPNYTPQRRGRPRKFTTEIKELIVEMAKQNKWGYTKIIGELKKLNIIKSSKTSIKNVLIEYGIDPLSIRSQDTWDQDIKILPTPYRSPNMNPYTKSWAATINMSV